MKISKNAKIVPKNAEYCDCSYHDKDINDYVCANCFFTVDKCGCSHDDVLIKVDRKIQEAVRILNLRKIKTEFCCEGHYRCVPGEINPRTNTYVKFKEDYPFQTLPEGFENLGQAISFDYDLLEYTRESFEDQKEKNLKNLVEWAKNVDVPRTYPYVFIKDVYRLE